MQRNMPPVPHYAWAGLPPCVPALSRQIVPMKGFGIELPRWPFGKPRQNIALIGIISSGARAMCGLRKLIIKMLIGADANEKNSSAILRYAVVLSVQHSAFHSVPREPISRQLII
jgi:hypothetical protein